MKIYHLIFNFWLCTKRAVYKRSNYYCLCPNDKLLATGESFPSVIKDDLGSFAISAEVTAPYLELKAEGYYFIENTGETSTSPIYLNALASSSQEKININLLTTLTSGRIKKLINEGKSFEVAKNKQKENLLTFFHFSLKALRLASRK